MIKLPFTPHIEGVLQKSKDLSIALKRNGVDLDLLFHCFINDLSLSCSSIIKKTGIDYDELVKDSKNILNKKRKTKKVSAKFKTDVRKFLKFCDTLCIETYSLDYIASEVILIAFFSEGFTPKVIHDSFPNGIEEAEEVLLGVITECSLVIRDFENKNIETALKHLEETPDHWIDMFDNNEILSQFAENLNAKAASGEFDKIVDYDGKIDELATILCRKKKPNAILVGPAGTGKTSLVEGLAMRIVEGDAPELIANKVIYSVSLSSMVAGTEYRGQFEKRLEDFVNESKKYTNLILFIDEVHTLIGAGGATNNSLEASNILKPELARGTISCIGATTINEYTNTIKKDTALDRRFERVIVREPSKFQMAEILPTIVSYYEDFHCVTYSDAFLDNIINYCEKYIPNKFYPDKAIDVIDHCGAQAKVNFWDIQPSIKEIQTKIVESALHPDKDHSQLVEKLNKSLEKWSDFDKEDKPEVELDHLKDFFEKKVNPLNKKIKVKRIFECISRSFVGQKEILDKLQHEIVLSSMGVRSEQRFSTPDCFIVSGEECNGKSFFCDLLEDSLNKHGVNVLSYNGVHFSDSFAPHKIASSQGTNTSICEKIIISPNSVIIIDDFHKIDLSAVPIFNQILKEGKIQMSNGDVADFSNCKIFLTSCLSQSQGSLGFQKNKKGQGDPLIHKDIYSLIKTSLILNKLKMKDLRRILWNKLISLRSNLKDNNIDLRFNARYVVDTIDELNDEKFKIKGLNEIMFSKIKPFISNSISDGVDRIKLYVDK